MGLGQIVVVANRGPNDFTWNAAQGRWVVRPASGGLVSMLTPLAQQPGVVWFCCVSEPPDAAQDREGLYTTAEEQTDPRLHVVPVPLPARTYHAYYGQISNEVLWMLQHHVLGPGGYQYADAARHQAWDTGYLAANQRLVQAVQEHCGRDDPPPRAFLVQDYHLYPLPALLRQAFPGTPILHFTHIPFPEAPLLKLLPPAWRTTILRGLLGANIVGVQTERDVEAFVRSCHDLLRLRTRSNGAACVQVEDGREVAVRAYPASVDAAELHALMAAPGVAAAGARLASAAGAARRSTIIRVDRLDPSKNQLVGFLAFRRLLETRPDLRGRVQFLAFLVPSRTDLGVYRAYRDRVYAAIEETNATFAGTCGGEPPITVYYTNDREQALAAMATCDALLVNSLEDGMNLVVKEWAIVARHPGSAIVSETAGVAAEAGPDCALLVSPLDVEGTAQAMAAALDMDPGERAARLDRLRTRVARWTARDWLDAQLRDLGLAPLAGSAAAAWVTGRGSRVTGEHLSAIHHP